MPTFVNVLLAANDKTAALPLSYRRVFASLYQKDFVMLRGASRSREGGERRGAQPADRNAVPEKYHKIFP